MAESYLHGDSNILTDEQVDDLFSHIEADKETLECLREKVRSQPENLLARLELLALLSNTGIYSPDFSEQLAWLITHYPEHRAHRWITYELRDKNYRALLAVWLSKVRTESSDSKVLFHAGRFCGLMNPRLAEILWLRAESCMNKNEDSALALAQRYYFKASETKNLALLNEATKFLFEALNRHRSAPNSQYLEVYGESMLLHFGKLALLVKDARVAKKLGNALLGMKERSETLTDFAGNSYLKMKHEFSNYNGFSIVGQAQLLESDSEAALASLEEMMRSSIPPEPDLSLVEELISLGFYAKTREFLLHCREELQKRIDSFGSTDSPAQAILRWSEDKNINQELVKQMALGPSKRRISDIDSLLQKLSS